MKKLFVILGALGLVFFCFNTYHVMAAEKVMEQDTVTTTTVQTNLVKTADNFIVLFDSSSSMNEPYLNTGMSKLEAAKEILKQQNKTLPDLGYNAGLYLASNFKPVYMLQKYDREKAAAALDQLPEKGSGATLFPVAMSKLRNVLKGLSGRTVVFLFTDGYYKPDPGMKKPSQIAKELSDKHDVCFYVISTAKGDQEKAILKAVSSINECSRVVPFDQVFEKPVYLAGALFVIETKIKEFLTTTYRVADVKINNILFDFNSDQVRPDYDDELNTLGEFLNNNPKTYVVLTGFTDTTGSPEYNLGLSRRRAESVEAYLVDKFNVSIEQIVTQWYGIDDPVASNGSPEGRQQNRRVESIVMGLD